MTLNQSATPANFLTDSLFLDILGVVPVQVPGIREKEGSEGPSRSDPVARHSDGTVQGGSALYVLRLEHLLCHREYLIVSL